MTKLIKKNWTKVLTIIIGLLLFYVAFRLIKKEDLFLELGKLGFIKTAVFVLIGLFIFVFHAYRWKIILTHFGKSLPYGYIFKIKLMTYPLTFLTPTAYFGSEPLRVYYLTKDKKTESSIGWSSVLLEGFFEIFVQSLMMVFAAFYIISEFVLSRKAEVIIIISSVVWLIVLIWVLKKLVYEKRFLGAALRKLEKLEGLKNTLFIRDAKAIDTYFISFFNLKNWFFWRALITSFIIFTIQIIEIWTLVWFLNLSLNLKDIFILRAIISLSAITPIPMFIGIAESLQLVFFSAYGLANFYAVLIPLVYRTSGLFYSTVGFILSIYNKVKNLHEEKN